MKDGSVRIVQEHLFDDIMISPGDTIRQPEENATGVTE